MLWLPTLLAAWGRLSPQTTFRPSLNTLVISAHTVPRNVPTSKSTWPGTPKDRRTASAATAVWPAFARCTNVASSGAELCLRARVSARVRLNTCLAHAQGRPSCHPAHRSAASVPPRPPPGSASLASTWVCAMPRSALGKCSRTERAQPARQRSGSWRYPLRSRPQQTPPPRTPLLLHNGIGLTRVFGHLDPLLQKKPPQRLRASRAENGSRNGLRVKSTRRNTRRRGAAQCAAISPPPNKTSSPTLSTSICERSGSKWCAKRGSRLGSGAGSAARSLRTPTSGNTWCTIKAQAPWPNFGRSPPRTDEHTQLRIIATPQY
eukprot:m.6715 g.6715  ORF g.6715 m.6715 type:complete len:320 (-) comp3875_c0_seq1:14-973(-)